MKNIFIALIGLLSILITHNLVLAQSEAQQIFKGTATGTNSYTVTPTATTSTTLLDGKEILMKVANTNTTAATVKVINTNGIVYGVKNIYLCGSALTGGELSTTIFNRLVYNQALDRFDLDKAATAGSLPTVSTFSAVLTAGADGNYIPIVKVGNISNVNGQYETGQALDFPGYWEEYTYDYTNKLFSGIESSSWDANQHWPYTSIQCSYFPTAGQPQSHRDIFFYVSADSVMVTCNNSAGSTQPFKGITYEAATSSIVATYQTQYSILHRAANDNRYLGQNSLTNTYIGFGASGVLSGSGDFTWNNTTKSHTQNNSSTSGNTNHTFSVGTEFAGFAKYGSAYASTYTGTSVNLASTFGISHINLVPVCLPIYMQALPLYISTGLTSGNLAYRFDATGLKIATNANINTSANSALDITGSMNLSGSATFGVSSSSNGSLIFKNSSNSNTITMNSGATSPSSYSLTLPIAQGASGTYLKNNGSGVLSWAVVTTSPTLSDVLGNGRNFDATGTVKNSSGLDVANFNYETLIDGASGIPTLDWASEYCNNSAGIATVKWETGELAYLNWTTTTQPAGTNNTTIATTSFVNTAIGINKTFLTAQTFTTGVTTPKTVTTYTTSASDNFFRVSGTINVTAISLDNIRFQVLYTDEQSNSNTLDMQFATNGGVTFANVITATGGYGIAPVDIRVKASTVITIQVNPVVGTGSATFNAGAIIQQL